MKKKKIASTALAVMMGISTLTYGAFSSPQHAEAEHIKESISKSYAGAPIDLGIANDERLIEMLKESGKISKNATPAEAEKALNKYLKERAANGKHSHGGELEDEAKESKEQLQAQMKSNGLDSGKGKKNGKTKGETVDGVTEEEWDGGTRTDKVLALLIEYPDYPASKIEAGDTDMYYEDYVKEHYTEMLFSDNGYTGPNGENLVSVKQFYEEQSGGSYTIEGEVAGWYQAKNPAAYYGGNNASDNDSNPRALVREALLAAAADPNLDLSQYDQEDRYDLDGDGNYREPDGLIDHLMIVHSSVGEEAGGGGLGADAVWSHRWSLGGIFPITGSPEPEVDYWGQGTMYGYDYTIEPADGAAGVFAHEYGHDLGLPDEYDTIYSGAGEAVAYWSIMSSGSWAGDIPGTEPTGFSAWSKEFLHSSMPGSNWLTGATVHADEVTSKGTEVLLDEAVTKGTNNDAVRIDLPDKVNTINTPASGEYEYFGGTGDEIDHTMVTEVDLTNATNATLDYDVWYNIESNWDYGMVQVSTDGGETWNSLSTPSTTSDIVEDGYPAIKENMPGYTGSSDGWMHETIDLSEYAGQTIQLQYRYMTDWGTTLDGMYVDNVTVTADGGEVVSDGAESEADAAFDLHGFKRDTGTFTSEHYYLLEWRSHNGVDEGLSHIRRGNSLMNYDAGLLVWYVDDAYDNNWTGVHPGEGFLGVVDADQIVNRWSDGALGTTRYQMHDAAFGLGKTEKMFLDYSDTLGITMKDNATERTPLFDDSKKYMTPVLPDAGRNVPTYGLKFRVLAESGDGTVGKVKIYK
ncbi:immune inhibitor A domain-containing protein [Alkalihalobacillus sp. TS-13]|uniref:immune inhibitor A domain-containing protein n=1 Tax=Alkalihalobacillus sp. TS-13 TaxID=2842455 RepID=UPI001C87066E|nr:immune inhibitor A domain-containing protein [Alkalihalobacillus sp. TS-13]